MNGSLVVSCRSQEDLQRAASDSPTPTSRIVLLRGQHPSPVLPASTFTQVFLFYFQRLQQYKYYVENTDARHNVNVINSSINNQHHTNIKVLLISQKRDLENDAARLTTLQFLESFKMYIFRMRQHHFGQNWAPCEQLQTMRRKPKKDSAPTTPGSHTGYPISRNK